MRPMTRMSRNTWFLILLFTLSPCHLVTLSSEAAAQLVVIDDLILLTSRQGFATIIHSATIFVRLQRFSSFAASHRQSP